MSSSCTLVELHMGWV